MKAPSPITLETVETWKPTELHSVRFIKSLGDPSDPHGFLIHDGLRTVIFNHNAFFGDGLCPEWHVSFGVKSMLAYDLIAYGYLELVEDSPEQINVFATQLRERLENELRLSKLAIQHHKQGMSRAIQHVESKADVAAVFGLDLRSYIEPAEIDAVSDVPALFSLVHHAGGTYDVKSIYAVKHGCYAGKSGVVIYCVSDLSPCVKYAARLIKLEPSGGVKAVIADAVIVYDGTNYVVMKSRFGPPGWSADEHATPSKPRLNTHPIVERETK